MNTFDVIQKALDLSLSGDGLMYSEAGLSELKASELKEILVLEGLKTYGTRAALVKRLLDNQKEEIFEVESTIIIRKEAEEETNDRPQERPGYVEPVTGVKV